MSKKEYYEPRQYKDIHEYEGKKPQSSKNAISHPAHNTNILPKERERSAPCNPLRHEMFQFGTNPMAMTNFEKGLVAKEKAERCAARDKYVCGIQGRDGGEFAHQQFESEYPDKF